MANNKLRLSFSASSGDGSKASISTQSSPYLMNVRALVLGSHNNGALATYKYDD